VNRSALPITARTARRAGRRSPGPRPTPSPSGRSPSGMPGRFGVHGPPRRAAARGAGRQVADITVVDLVVDALSTVINRMRPRVDRLGDLDPVTQDLLIESSGRVGEAAVDVQRAAALSYRLREQRVAGDRAEDEKSSPRSRTWVSTGPPTRYATGSPARAACCPAPASTTCSPRWSGPARAHRGRRPPCFMRPAGMAHHFVCRSCHRVFDWSASSAPAPASPRHRRGRRRGSPSDLRGVCTACAAAAQ